MNKIVATQIKRLADVPQIVNDIPGHMLNVTLIDYMSDLHNAAADSVFQVKWEQAQPLQVRGGLNYRRDMTVMLAAMNNWREGHNHASDDLYRIKRDGLVVTIERRGAVREGAWHRPTLPRDRAGAPLPDMGIPEFQPNRSLATHLGTPITLLDQKPEGPDAPQ